jgi:hypothetical protein
MKTHVLILVMVTVVLATMRACPVPPTDPSPLPASAHVDSR